MAKLRKEGYEHKAAFTKSAEIWGGLSDKEKEPYLSLNKKDQERHDRQMKELEEKGFFMNEDGTKSTEADVDPKKRFGKDVLLPKRPLSAYLFFTGENMQKVREENGCTHVEAMKKCAEIWNSMSDKDKKKYHDMHDKDVKRQEDQLAELSKNGFFMLEDGTKSSDHVAKIKKKKVKKNDNTESEDQDGVKPEKIKKSKK